MNQNIMQVNDRLVQLNLGYRTSASIVVGDDE